MSTDIPCPYTLLLQARGTTHELPAAMSAGIMSDVSSNNGSNGSVEFAERLRAIREARDMGVNELNQAAALSMGSVTRLELGERKSINAQTVAQLAAALDVNMHWLWTGEGSAARPSGKRAAHVEIATVVKATSRAPKRRPG